MVLKTILIKLVKWLYPLVRLYWFIFRPKSSGVRGVVENSGRILLIRNTYGNNKLWMFPGGGIKKYETPQQAFIREIKEEVGLDINQVKQIGEYTSTKEYKIDNVKVFAGISYTSNLKTEAIEILEAKWFIVNNLPIISPNAKKILSMWLNQKI